MSSRPTGRWCGSTTATAAGAESTPRLSWTSGPGGSPSGAAGPTCSSTSTTTGRASPWRTACRSCGGCGGLQAVEGPPEQPRDVHLRVADALADLTLSEVLHEAELQHLP